MSERDVEDNANSESSSDDRRTNQPESTTTSPIGKQLREKSRKSSSMNTNQLINELIGYGSGLLFFGLSGFIFFGFFSSPGMTPEYRSILSLILFLYGLYRVVTTRGKSNAAKRRERLMKHRSERSSDHYDS